MKLVKIFILAFLFVVLNACEKDESITPTEYIGLDKVAKIELYPNSIQLMADGKAQLEFKARCYYYVKDSILVPMLPDRIPLDQIEITPSEGQKFKLSQPYSTQSKSDSIAFYCQIGKLKSNQVKVALTKAVAPIQEKVVVPIVFHAIYTEKTKNNIESLNVEYLQKLIDRANSVFANGLKKSPSSFNSGISFKIQQLDLVKVSDDIAENQGKLYQYIAENLISDPSKYLNIWLLNNSMWNLAEQDCVPRYTLADPENIPGLELQKINDIGEIKQINPEDVGFPIVYSTLYQMSQGYTLKSFEYYLGSYYGLIPTGHYDEENPPLKDNDLDFCPDTYSYVVKQFSIQKKTFPIGGNKNKVYFYDSFNIMDEISSAMTVSKDQILRIKRVMKDCPFRQMKI